MEPLYIQCNVCFQSTLVSSNANQSDNGMYIVPLLTFTQCPHHFCVNCMKTIKRPGEPHTCPMCRKRNTKMRIVAVNDNRVHSIEITLGNIKLMSTSPNPINIKELVATMYAQSVIRRSPSPAIAAPTNDDAADAAPTDNDAAPATDAATVFANAVSELTNRVVESVPSDSAAAAAGPSSPSIQAMYDELDSLSNRLTAATQATLAPLISGVASRSNGRAGNEEGLVDAVTQLSYVQNQLETLSRSHQDSLDLAQQLEENVESLRTQVREKEAQITELDGFINVRFNEVNKLRVDEIEQTNKVLSLKRKYSEIQGLVTTEMQEYERLKKQNTFFTLSNTALLNKNKEMTSEKQRLQTKINNIVCHRNLLLNEISSITTEYAPSSSPSLLAQTSTATKTRRPRDDDATVSNSDAIVSKNSDDDDDNDDDDLAFRPSAAKMLKLL
ncbi:cg30 [Peridroma alphabaculovirus]|uniref:Cg30 n=1 Tax=Peridroma alphabaculovirus TaxID=1346829 RepID=A0A068LKT3_9ABAC|nr:cg30 [Peridroma alphabaculovirus]AIE47798.1 cg30 [Peridroma alphabaculovirus]